MTFSNNIQESNQFTMAEHSRQQKNQLQNSLKFKTIQNNSRGYQNKSQIATYGQNNADLDFTQNNSDQSHPIFIYDGNPPSKNTGPIPSRNSITTAVPSTKRNKFEIGNLSNTSYMQKESAFRGYSPKGPIGQKKQMLMPHLVNQFKLSNNQLTPVAFKKNSLGPSSPQTTFGTHNNSVVYQSPGTKLGDNNSRFGKTALISPNDSKELLVGQENKFLHQKRSSATAMTYSRNFQQSHQTQFPPAEMGRMKRDSLNTNNNYQGTSIHFNRKENIKIQEKQPEFIQKFNRRKISSNRLTLDKKTTLNLIKDGDSLPRLSQMDLDNRYLVKSRFGSITVEDERGHLEQQRRNMNTATKICRDPQMLTKYLKRATFIGDEQELRSPYKKVYNHKTANKSNLERKSACDGRYNKRFLPGTPTVNDADIQDLIKKYPLDPTLKEEEKMDAAARESQLKPKTQQSFHPQFADHYKAVHAMDRDERNKQINKDIEILAGHATNSSNETQKTFQNFLSKMVCEEFRVKEVKKVTELLQEVEFAEVETLFGMFDYRQKDTKDKIRQQVVVKQEYKEGCLDPNKYKSKSTRKKKK